MFKSVQIKSQTYYGTFHLSVSCKNETENKTELIGKGRDGKIWLYFILLLILELGVQILKFQYLTHEAENLLLFQLLAILSMSGWVALSSLKVPVKSKQNSVIAFLQLVWNCNGKTLKRNVSHFHLKGKKDRSSVHMIYINYDVNSTSVALYQTIYMYPRILGNVDEITGNILFILCSFPRLIECHQQFDSDLIRSWLAHNQVKTLYG